MHRSYNVVLARFSQFVISRSLRSVLDLTTIKHPSPLVR